MIDYTMEEMSEERIAIVQAVLEGFLPADRLTMAELEYVQQRVNELVEEKILKEAESDGKNVFSGVENGKVN
jgi:hypothetical protein